MKTILNLFAVLLLSSSGAYFFAPMSSSAATAAVVSSPFVYNFASDGKVVETSSTNNSSSGYWWVNSGAGFSISGGRGHTVQGALLATDPWRTLYAANNPTDTDNGYHPQNIFRLVGRSLWNNFSQQIYFKINADNLSESPNRNASNGLLLFNRYKDAYNLYYTGVRVDGYAVIKKKVGGTYYTLALEKVFPGTYDKTSSPNLLPKNTWLGIRSVVADNPDGSVSIKVYLDKNWNGRWELVAQAIDTGAKGAIVRGAGYGGIRTDFMDVTFDQYKMENL